MKLGAKNDTKAKMKSVGKIRKAQLISTFGPGAIAEMPEYTVIMGAIDYWKTKGAKHIQEPTLEGLTEMSYFIEPYSSESNNPKGNPDIPAFRFPRIHFCPSCGKLDDYKNFGDTKEQKCIACNRVIVPSRFVVSCINGHLEDFPFEWWVHYGDYYSCKKPEVHNKTLIEFKNNTGGLASIVIKCKECDAQRTMEGCMSKNALKGYKCKGRRPWVGFKSETNDPEECKAPMRALQRGASNLYYSLTQSALTIPPWSSRVQNLLDEKWDSIQTAYDNNMDESFFKPLLGILFKDVIEEGRFTVEDFENAIKDRMDRRERNGSYSEQMMYEEEYKALCAGASDDDYDEDGSIEPGMFKAEITEVSDFLQDYFDEVVLVKRLREVLALTGFRRITPVAPTEDEDAFEGANNNPFMTLYNKKQTWLPAIEMRGEGIFITLNPEKLKTWESLVGNRYEAMRERIGNTRVDKGMFSSRYVLLHTIAHMLIRQLTIDCGYQEAALKERIYSTYPSNEDDERQNLEMAGILIYTSASDSDGSLGGLVRQGESDLLETTIRNILQEASWCSSDPLCIESTAQGFNSLNYAACHACMLLPETSCTARNCLLDRAAVVGKPTDRSIGFFGDLMGGI